mgnify:CR=1 FL=1
MSLSKINKRNRIKKRIRQHVIGSKSRPRLSVFRSNKEIYAQVIDDFAGNTLACASSADAKGTKIEQATVVGKLIAEKAVEALITEALSLSILQIQFHYIFRKNMTN